MNLSSLKSFLSVNRPHFIRYGTIAFGILFFTGYIWFSRQIVERIERQNDQIAETYAQCLSQQMSILDSQGSFAQIAARTIAIYPEPVIVTDNLWQPVAWRNIRYHGALWSDEEDSPDTSSKKQILSKTIIDKKVREFVVGCRPVPVFCSGSEKPCGYLVRGMSRLAIYYSYIPFLGIFGCLLLLGVITLRGIQTRRADRSRLFTGLTKETVHQFGTPISALMGWVEYLRQIGVDDLPKEQLKMQVALIADDMSSDVTRLNKVVNRFSLLGSIPKTKIADVNLVVRDVLAYFGKRLPTIGNKISFVTDLGTLPQIPHNYILLEWAFECVLKNALDALAGEKGVVTVSTQFIAADARIRINIKDSGKGIPPRELGRVFVTGFSTKRRGWGIGLTLARRIVQEYHNGKIYVASTQRGIGTTISIDLPVQ